MTSPHLHRDDRGVAENGTAERTAERRDDARDGCSPYLRVDEVAARLHLSRRTVHEMTRRRAIPHRVLPGSRRCLFREDELAAWEDGAELEVIEPRHGGRIVRPIRTRGVRAPDRFQGET